ncbi:MAG: rod shape-determining protein MreC [Bacteroidetes bacterium]|jgi:rod shape-determining protein MreC|nr:rod shape-determining protein MreC [Bacteroidota bacterium]
MRSWDDFLGNFGATLLFIALQVLCLYLIVQYNERQRTIFNHTSLVLSSEIDARIDRWNSYWALKSESQKLHEDNARLLTKLRRLERQIDELKVEEGPQNPDSCFFYYPARVIKNQTQSRYNHIIIDAGRQHGLKEGTAVISDEGVVGKTDYCSEKFCSVMPLIHVQSSVSAAISNTDYFGQLEWRGRDIRYAQLEGIPKHISVQKGAAVLTSGYSTIFPRGEIIGEIDEVELPKGSNFYDIRVKLSVNFAALRQVYWIENKDREEIISIIENRGYDQK